MKRWILLVICVLCVGASAAAFFPRTTGDFKMPEKFSSMPDNVSFDVVLLRYSGDAVDVNRTCNIIFNQIGGGRVIVYPEGYVPILVKEDKVDEVKRQLAPSSVVVCRVGLE